MLQLLLGLRFGRRDVRAPRVRLDQPAVIDNVELAVRLDLADHHRLGHVVVGAHHHVEPGRRADLLADHRLADRVDIGRAGLVTACAHMWNRMYSDSIGSLVTRFGSLV